jgi:hypothetical protein
MKKKTNACVEVGNTYASHVTIAVAVSDSKSSGVTRPLTPYAPMACGDTENVVDNSTSSLSASAATASVVNVRELSPTPPFKRTLVEHARSDKDDDTNGDNDDSDDDGGDGQSDGVVFIVIVIITAAVVVVVLVGCSRRAAERNTQASIALRTLCTKYE